MGPPLLARRAAQVGFPRRDPARLALALQNTYRTVWVRAARKSRLARQGALLGFARATSDGALSAVIWDVAVAPAWQRGGLGRALMERLTASLVNDGIATITLYAGEGAGRGAVGGRRQVLEHSARHHETSIRMAAVRRVLGQSKARRGGIQAQLGTALAVAAGPARLARA